jgi:hypothetical protein
VELEDGSTAQFLASFNVLDNGARRGHLQVRPAEGHLKWARYRVEQARVICEDETPVGVCLTGTVQQRAANDRPTTSSFTAQVTPDTEIEECLCFDISGPVITQQRARVEAEGMLWFTSNACANGSGR